MTNKNLLLVFIIISLFSACRKHDENYANGKVKRQFKYFKGNSEYLCKEYDEKGILISKNFYFFGGECNIKKEYLDSFNLISSFREDIKYGNWYKTTKKGATIDEYFFINGEEKLFKKQFVSTDMCKFEVYLVEDMKAVLLGELFFDSTLRYLPDYSTFFNVSYYDKVATIKDTVKIKFDFYSKLQDIKLVLGELDENYNLVSTDPIDTIRINGNNYIHKVSHNKHGINIIQGMFIGTHLYFDNDKKVVKKQLRKIPIYINFYVVSNQDAKDNLEDFFK